MFIIHLRNHGERNWLEYIRCFFASINSTVKRENHTWPNFDFCWKLERWTKMTTTKRPLVLLHKCPNCTTFALAPVKFLDKLRDPDEVCQRFSRIRFNSAPSNLVNSDEFGFGSSFEDNSVFDEDDQCDLPQPTQDNDDSNDSSSGHSSLDGSPISETCPIDSSSTTARISSVWRPWSVSECEGVAVAPVKGILKRRSAVGRSLSESVAENVVVDVSADCLVDNGGYLESGDEDESRNQPLALKKTVRFSDRVQQALFRPDSSILDPKRKCRRDQTGRRESTKRKRRSSSLNCGQDESEVGVQHDRLQSGDSALGDECDGNSPAKETQPS